MKNMRRTLYAIACLCLTSILLAACATAPSADAGGGLSDETVSVSVSAPADDGSAASTPAETDTPVPAESTASAIAVSIPPDSLVYQNTTYGFDFYLPESWNGYSVVTDKWEGRAIDADAGIIATGPELLLRSPKWTAETPTQDIPIMIFTTEQWGQLANEEFTVSAAPIGPSELGNNSKYVFALPPRYNFAYPAGFEEVEDILSGNPLRANENIS